MMSIGSFIMGLIFKLPPVEIRDVAVDKDISIPMPDGVILKADRYYSSSNPKLPAILVRSVYGRRGPIGTLYGRLFAERGFQVLIQCCRGTFDSGGRLNPFFDERTDGLATIEWIKKQDWFSGELATMGYSYLGYTQWAMVGEAGPELKAVATAVTASQFRGQTYPGDSLCLHGPLSWTVLVNMQEGSPMAAFKMMRGNIKEVQKAFMHLPLSEADMVALGKKVNWWQEWLENSEPEYDWWQPADHSKKVAGVSAPVNMVGGWYDIFLPWQLKDYASLKQAGKTPYLTIGPWTHVSLGTMAESSREALIWLKAHIKGEKDLLRKNPVRLFIMGSKQWKEFDRWPPAEYKAQPWYLQSNSKLAKSLPDKSQPDRYRYDPADPTPTLGGVMMSMDAGPKNNNTLESRPDVLTYTSGLLDSEVEVVGSVRAELYVKSSLQYTDFFARLCDVEPSGKSINICDGIQRLRPGRPSAEQDGVIKVDIDLWPTAYCFKPGHCIRLQISSGAHPRFCRNNGSGEPLAMAVKLIAAGQEIFHDPEHSSAVILPVKQ
jgi:putative CocE/NonD family hydrolase